MHLMSSRFNINICTIHSYCWFPRLVVSNIFNRAPLASGYKFSRLEQIFMKLTRIKFCNAECSLLTALRSAIWESFHRATHNHFYSTNSHSPCCFFRFFHFPIRAPHFSLSQLFNESGSLCWILRKSSRQTGISISFAPNSLHVCSDNRNWNNSRHSKQEFKVTVEAEMKSH